MENDIKFVARHYRKGLFATDKALRRMGIRRFSLWTPAKIAAASVALVVLSATAAVIIRKAYMAPESPAVAAPSQAAAPIVAEIKAIDFENAPLPAVVDKIKEVYGVEIDNMPENAKDYTLSLHYEGTAADLVGTINEILGTDLSIREK